MKKLKFLVWLLFLTPSIAFGATFTSTTNGNWNDGATWGNTSPGTPGTDFPITTGGDTFTISSGHEVTIPAGYSTISSGNIADSTSGDHGKLIITGTLDLDGNLTLNDWAEIYGSPGGELDLNGNSVACGVDNTDEVYLTFQGTSGNHFTVTTTGSAGTFTRGTNAMVHNNSDYTDYSGLGASYLGTGYYSHTAQYNYCTFTGLTATVYLVNSSNVDQAFTISHCDWRNATSGVAACYVNASGAPSASQTRLIEYSTFSNTSGYGLLSFNVEEGTINYSIFDEWLLQPSQPGHTFEYNFHHTENTSNDKILSLVGVDLEDFQNNYIYVPGLNAHTIENTGSVSVGSIVSNNIFEATDSETNHIVPGTSNVTVEKNIVIGNGTLFTGNTDRAGTYTINRNTLYVDQAGNESMLVLTEGAGTEFTGTVTAKNNLIYDADTTTDSVGLYLVTSTADQISTNYNCFYGSPGGDVNDHYSPDIAFDIGVNDLVVDPQFTDKTRNLASWDDSLDGAGSGSATEAITEILKLNGTGGTFNTDYNVSDLMTYIRAGFTPTNSALDGTGDGGVDIGAVDFSAGAATAHRVIFFE